MNDAHVRIYAKQKGHTAQGLSITGANSSLSFENEGNALIQAKSNYGATGLYAVNSTIDFNNTGDTTIRAKYTGVPGTPTGSGAGTIGILADTANISVGENVNAFNVEAHGQSQNATDGTPADRAYNGTAAISAEKGSIDIKSKEFNVKVSATALSNNAYEVVGVDLYDTSLTTHNTKTHIDVSDVDGYAVGLGLQQVENKLASVTLNGRQNIVKASGSSATALGALGLAPATESDPLNQLVNIKGKFNKLESNGVSSISDTQEGSNAYADAGTYSNALYSRTGKISMTGMTNILDSHALATAAASSNLDAGAGAQATVVTADFENTEFKMIGRENKLVASSKGTANVNATDDAYASTYAKANALSMLSSESVLLGQKNVITAKAESETTTSGDYFVGSDSEAYGLDMYGSKLLINGTNNLIKATAKATNSTEDAKAYARAMDITESFVNIKGFNNTVLAMADGDVDSDAYGLKADDNSLVNIFGKNNTIASKAQDDAYGLFAEDDTTVNMIGQRNTISALGGDDVFAVRSIDDAVVNLSGKVNMIDAIAQEGDSVALRAKGDYVELQEDENYGTAINMSAKNNIIHAAGENVFGAKVKYAQLNIQGKNNNIFSVEGLYNTTAIQAFSSNIDIEGRNNILSVTSDEGDANAIIANAGSQVELTGNKNILSVKSMDEGVATAVSADYDSTVGLFGKVNRISVLAKENDTGDAVAFEANNGSQIAMFGKYNAIDLTGNAKAYAMKATGTDTSIGIVGKVNRITADVDDDASAINVADGAFAVLAGKKNIIDVSGNGMSSYAIDIGESSEVDLVGDTTILSGRGIEINNAGELYVDGTLRLAKGIAGDGTTTFEDVKLVATNNLPLMIEGDINVDGALDLTEASIVNAVSVKFGRYSSLTAALTNSTVLSADTIEFAEAASDEEKTQLNLFVADNSLVNQDNVLFDATTVSGLENVAFTNAFYDMTLTSEGEVNVAVKSDEQISENLGLSNDEARIISAVVDTQSDRTEQGNLLANVK